MNHHAATKKRFTKSSSLRLQELLLSFIVLSVGFQWALFIIHPSEVDTRAITAPRLTRNLQRYAKTLVDTYRNTPITVKVGDITSTITLHKLGVQLNQQQVYSTLVTTGSAGDMFLWAPHQSIDFFGQYIPFFGKPGYNDELAKAYIATLNQKASLTPQNAAFVYKDQNVTIRADTFGQTIDTNVALQALQRANPFNTNRIVVPVTQIPATITASMLQPLLPKAEAVAQKPLTIVAGNHRITLTAKQLVGIIAPSIEADSPHGRKPTARITFDKAKLNSIIDDVVKKAVVAPQPTIMNGNHVVQQGVPGIQLQDNQTLARVLHVLNQRQSKAAPSTERIEIPLASVAAPIIQQPSPPHTHTGTGLVRLTFDDGPGAYTEQILDILKRYGVRATFYVLGQNAQGNPATMQRIAREGHTIGNHSFSHANLAWLSPAGVAQELASTQAAIQRTCGVTPRHFRPPYGAQNQTVREVAASMGLSVDLWSVDTQDWAQPSSGVITQRTLAGTGPGVIILLHVLHPQTVDALPSIIEGVRSQGFTLE